MPDYDIIILGAGMAGLSLAYRGLVSGIWKDKKILIIERDKKIKNDKTFCFWSESGNTHLQAFESIIKHKWSDMKIFEYSGSQIPLKKTLKTTSNNSYQYNLIHSLDFYETILEYLGYCNNVKIEYQEVLELESNQSQVSVKTKNQIYSAKNIFDTRSPLIPKITPNSFKNSKTQYFLQHFKGVKLQIINHGFDLKSVHLMDFRTSQEFGTAFFYLLPFNQNEIFVEYTLFNKKLLDEVEYDKQIKIYLKEVLKLESVDNANNANSYKILETEFGIIPMTDYKFKRYGNGDSNKNNKRIINLGTRGGDTRGSTGYTFYNTQRTISSILDSYKSLNNPSKFQEPVSKLNKYFDSIFLRVLDSGLYPGSDLFADIFKKAKLESILKFLDGESNPAETFQIINSVRKPPFIKNIF